MAKENEYRVPGSRYSFILSAIMYAASLIYVYWVLSQNFDLNSIRTIQILIYVFVIGPLFLALSFMRTSIRYTIREDSLFVITAFKGIEIKYSAIRQVEETFRSYAQFRSPATAPGNDQIRIVYDGNNEIFISPERKEEFVTKLRSRLPGSVIVKNSEGRQL